MNKIQSDQYACKKDTDDVRIFRREPIPIRNNREDFLAYIDSEEQYVVVCVRSRYRKTCTE